MFQLNQNLLIDLKNLRFLKLLMYQPNLHYRLMLSYLMYPLYHL
jgi:hypothetical protein